ncbi:MAG: DUF1800 domain-containing protein [Shimia sp.]|nr:DUF1800 domain-containing protein [Shimia sp.]
MSFSPTLAVHRFGYGMSPKVPSPASVSAMLDDLSGPDRAAKQFALPPTKELHAMTEEFRKLRKARGAAQDAGEENSAAEAAFAAFQKQRRKQYRGWMAQTLLRRVWSEDGFRERLVDFWADHFSAPGKRNIFRFNALHYVDDAIRPHVSGRFEDMLLAAVLHPQMLHFLDQSASVGPNSAFAKARTKRGVGLNENLAREILELHTLGVGGQYGQDDVRQLAKLLTGLRTNFDKRTVFDPSRAEPGSETVLGQSYGGDGEAVIADIHAVLRNLARHPDTAEHLAQKMAVHFVADQPDDAMIATMKSAYLETDGDLSAMCAAMLQHPAAWAPERRNFKQPVVFLCSAMRGLAVPKRDLRKMGESRMRRIVDGPLRTMGQPIGIPLGPDGFEEGDAHWLSPQGLAARLQWSLAAPTVLSDPLPDPREFVVDVLGDDAPKEVLFAAKAAENRREGVALVLMSPAFQRM